jgi:hypothetical protein
MRDPETGIVATGNGVAVQLAELKQRLTFAEEQLEAAETELHRTRTERDFYRQLVGDPAPERSDPTNQSRR